jgi:hypothetical protein
VEATGTERVPLYLSPADSSVSSSPVTEGQDPGNSSYAANKVGFAGLPSFTSGFSDGTSATIAFAEHFARCGPKGRFNFIFSLRSSRHSRPQRTTPSDLLRSLLPRRRPGSQWEWFHPAIATRGHVSGIPCARILRSLRPTDTLCYRHVRTSLRWVGTHDSSWHFAGSFLVRSDAGRGRNHRSRVSDRITA